MNKIICIFLFLVFISFVNSREKFLKSENKFYAIDTTKKYCHQFKKLSSAEKYFRSANNRTKECRFDSVAKVVAAKEYGLAVALNPSFWQARRNYARQLTYLKQYKLAIEQLNKALKIVSYKENPDLIFMRGLAYYENGNFQKAIADFDIAIKYQGNIEFTLLAKAKAQWKIGNIEIACENYHKSISLAPHLSERKEFILCN